MYSLLKALVECDVSQVDNSDGIHYNFNELYYTKI